MKLIYLIILFSYEMKTICIPITKESESELINEQYRPGDSGYAEYARRSPHIINRAYHPDVPDFESQERMYYRGMPATHQRGIFAEPRQFPPERSDFLDPDDPSNPVNEAGEINVYNRPLFRRGIYYTKD